MNYFMDDFTLENYKKILKLAISKFEFTTYDNLHLENFILWRHDCDFSLNRALKLAKIENSLGIQATYFINIHSEFYNVFEKSQTQKIFELLNLNHKIGLHFDTAYYNITSEAELSDKISWEANLLRRMFDFNIDVFSFHNPDKFALSCEATRYGGLINCYSKWFKKNVSYCSDSNGYWRHKRLEDIIRDPNIQKLHVLTHPGWWQDSVMYPRDKILRCVEGRAKANMNDYDDFLIRAGRVNLG